MHPEKVLHNWLNTVLPNMHKKRQEALKSVVSSGAHCGRLTVTSLGRSIENEVNDKHNIKRADRLLSNNHLQNELFSIYKGLSNSLVGKTQRPIILVDWSDIDKGKKFFLLRASTPMGGRSLTLYEEVHAMNTREKPKTHQTFLDNLKKMLPATCKPIIVTDAGFSTPWFVQVQNLGWDWVGRVRSRHLIKDSKTSVWKSCKEFHSQATSKPKSLGEVGLTRSNNLKCCLVVFKAKSKKRKSLNKFGKIRRSTQNKRSARSANEPWLLATSLKENSLFAKRVVKLYQTRMQIEEEFRDLKSARFGLSLEYSGTYKVNRLAVLILIGTLIVNFAYILGAAICNSKVSRQFQANTVTKHNVLSNVFIGLLAFRKSRFRIDIKLFKTTMNSLFYSN